MNKMLYSLLLSSALAYEPVKSVSFQDWVQTGSLKIDDLNSIQYSVHRLKNTGYPVDLLTRGINLSSIKSVRKINKIKPGLSPCKKNEKLEIFEITSDHLNKDDMVPEGYFSSGNMLGYFDPRDSEIGINSIVLTKNSEFINFQIITHEVAHHWYSSYCLEEYTEMTSEEFAQEIQFSLKEFNNYD